MHDWLYSVDSSFIILFVFICSILLWELGFRIGTRLSTQKKNKEEPQSLAIEAAVLTVFGLILGFTFSMSANRFELRKQTMVDEANAIGTSYLRASILSEGPRKEMQGLIRQYLDARIGNYQAAFQSPVVAETNQKANELQGKIWTLATDEARKSPTPLAASLITSLNEMIDLREKQNFGFENLVPQPVIILLIVLSLLSMTIVGLLNGATTARQITLSLVFAIGVAATLFLVLDLDRPKRGLIKLSYESFTRLRDDLNKPAINYY